MLELRMDGTRDELLEQLTERFPAWQELCASARELVGNRNKREVWPQEAALLTFLASQFNVPGAYILEIGANRGYSAACMRLAAPLAHVTTLEPHRGRRSAVRKNLRALKNVSVRPEGSVAFLDVDPAQRYDMIFVDGNHEAILHDLPWYNRLQIGGLFLHHDFSPVGSSRPCRPVFDALNEFSRVLRHEPEVLMRDETDMGMAGWYRQADEVWDA